MSTRLVLYLLALPLLVLTSCQRTSSRGEAEIREWLDRWAKAFSAHDVNTIMSLYAPDVVAYDLGPPLQTLGKDTYSKNYKQLLSQYEGPVEVEYRDLHITAAEDVGFANGLERFSGTIKGQKSTMWARFTSGFRKTNGVWLDVHDHVSVPADFESGKALLDLKP